MAQAKTAARKPRRKEKKNIALGQAHIKSTFNNTIVSITDPSGAVISWASSGGVGFKGSRKSTPYAAGMAAESAARQAQEHGVKKVDVFVKGPGSGRETAIRSLQAAGLEVGSINDVTPQAHNGCRPPEAPPRLTLRTLRQAQGPRSRIASEPATPVTACFRMPRREASAEQNSTHLTHCKCHIAGTSTERNT